MIITIESTTKIVEINGVPARIWEGHTIKSGIPVHCYVTRIAVDREDDTSQFEAELKQQRPPSPAVEGIPLRLIL
jgi:hypothetical protein